MPALLNAQCVFPTEVDTARVIQIAPIIVVNSLEGFVVDGSGKKIKDAKVEEKSEDGKRIIQSAVSDDEGHFALRSVSVLGQHFLQISEPGGDVIQMYVIVDKRNGKLLTIHLPEHRNNECDDVISDRPSAKGAKQG